MLTVSDPAAQALRMDSAALLLSRYTGPEVAHLPRVTDWHVTADGIRGQLAVLWPMEAHVTYDALEKWRQHLGGTTDRRPGYKPSVTCVYVHAEVDGLRVEVWDVITTPHAKETEQ